MGQGLFQKVAQVAAEEFGIGLERVHITATSTDKVPNTSATAASSGTDLNGMAVQRARARDQGAARRVSPARPGTSPKTLSRSATTACSSATRAFRSANLTKKAYAGRVHLSAAGFYKTPKLHWDRDKGKGRPFFYFAYGAACSEVVIDILTGEMKVRRADILHDVGRSLNPAIDIGQIEGGFVQGMGWLTTEELVYRRQGPLAYPRASTYKIPVASDVPHGFPGCVVRRQQSRGDGLSVEGGRRAAADAGDFGVRGDRGCDPFAASGQAGRARCPGDPGSDPEGVGPGAMAVRRDRGSIDEARSGLNRP